MQSITLAIVATALMSPLAAQGVTVIIPDNHDGTQVAEADSNGDKFAVTISKNDANPDTTVVVVEVDAEGHAITGRVWELSGDGDGTGWLSIPAGHKLLVEDPDDQDSDSARVSVATA